MKNIVNSPFKSMTEEQEKAFFDADIDTNKHGKREIEKDRKTSNISKGAGNFLGIQDTKTA